MIIRISFIFWISIIGNSVLRIARVRNAASGITLGRSAPADNGWWEGQALNIRQAATLGSRRFSCGRSCRSRFGPNPSATADNLFQISSFTLRLLLDDQCLGFVARVITNWVDNYAGLFDLSNVVVVLRRIAMPINAIGEEHDCLAAFDRL